MMDLESLVNYLHDNLELSSIDDFCPNGLQVDSGHHEITQITTAVSASLETIDAAIALKPQVLLVHHGIFWNKDSLCITGVKRDKIKRLLDHGISLLAYHLPLDCHQKWGNNYKAAHDMGWKNLQGFGPRCPQAQLGVFGEIPPTPVAAFQEKLEDFYNHSATTALGGPQIISKVALISGGAHREIEQAAKAGADAFITGSFDEPTWHLAKELNIHFFAMGHSNTEKIGVQTLGNHLKQKFHLTHHFLDIPNPF